MINVKNENEKQIKNEENMPFRYAVILGSMVFVGCLMKLNIWVILQIL